MGLEFRTYKVLKEVPGSSPVQHNKGSNDKARPEEVQKDAHLHGVSDSDDGATIMVVTFSLLLVGEACDSYGVDLWGIQLS